MKGQFKLVDIRILKSMNKLEKIAITKHAKIRLLERGISVEDIVNAIDTGEIL